MRQIAAPVAAIAARVAGTGCPYSFSPTLTIATAASTAWKNAGTDVAAPWCGTFSTAACSEIPASNSASCAGSSDSLAIRIVAAPNVARRMMPSLLVSDSVPLQQRSGRQDVQPEATHGDALTGPRVADQGSSSIATSRSAWIWEVSSHPAAAQARPGSGQHRRQPDDVIGMRMARHDDVEPLDPEGRQVRRDLLIVRAAVDQHVRPLRGC
ncbi:MAG: hypothetical protein U0V56_13015 [Actinomycetota bacterium]